MRLLIDTTNREKLVFALLEDEQEIARAEKAVKSWGIQLKPDFWYFVKAQAI